MDYLFCEWGGVDGSIQPQEKAVLELPRSATRYFMRVCVTQPLCTGLHQPAARESPSAACCNSPSVACRNSPCLAVTILHQSDGLGQFCTRPSIVSTSSETRRRHSHKPPAPHDHTPAPNRPLSHCWSNRRFRRSRTSISSGDNGGGGGGADAVVDDDDDDDVSDEASNHTLASAAAPSGGVTTASAGT